MLGIDVDVVVDVASDMAASMNSGSFLKGFKGFGVGTRQVSS